MRVDKGVFRVTRCSPGGCLPRVHLEGRIEQLLLRQEPCHKYRLGRRHRVRLPHLHLCSARGSRLTGVEADHVGHHWGKRVDDVEHTGRKDHGLMVGNDFGGGT